MELSRRELNVLRRLLNRAEFKPQDIAHLGLARIASAPGLGEKGLQNVLAWLAEQGFELRTEATDEHSHRRQRLDRRLENAQHLLETWGWQVHKPDLQSGEAAD